MRPFAFERHIDAIHRCLCGDCFGRSTFALAATVTCAALAAQFSAAVAYVFQIISWASKAFVTYYALQAAIAAGLARRDGKGAGQCLPLAPSQRWQRQPRYWARLWNKAPNIKSTYPIQSSRVINDVIITKQIVVMSNAKSA